MKSLVLASIACLGTVFAAAFAITCIDGLRSGLLGLAMAAVVAEGTTLVALVVLAVWGWPVHWFLKSRKRESLLSYSIAGALPGVVLVPSFKPFGNDTVPELMLQAVTLGVIGALAAMVFWIFLRRSHDRWAS